MNGWTEGLCKCTCLAGRVLANVRRTALHCHVVSEIWPYPPSGLILFFSLIFRQKTKFQVTTVNCKDDKESERDCKILRQKKKVIVIYFFSLSYLSYITISIFHPTKPVSFKDTTLPFFPYFTHDTCHDFGHFSLPLCATYTHWLLMMDDGRRCEHLDCQWLTEFKTVVHKITPWWPCLCGFKRPLTSEIDLSRNLWVSLLHLSTHTLGIEAHWQSQLYKKVDW